MAQIIDFEKFRKAKMEQEESKQKMLDEIMSYLEFTMDFDADFDVNEWFDNLDTITYNINTSIDLEDNEKTKDPS